MVRLLKYALARALLPPFAVGNETIVKLGDVTRPTAVLDPQRKAAFDAYLGTRLP